LSAANFKNILTMKSTRRFFFPLLLALFSLGIAGCAEGGSTLESLRENAVLQNVARAVLTGKVFDRAAIAVRNNDENALQNATDELEKIDPLAAAEQLVKGALWLDVRAMNEKNPALKTELETQAAQKYRQALKIAPTFPSHDAMLLNALGYFLADRGTSPEDFQTAEKLTRAALKLLDAEIAEIEGAPLSGTLLAIKKFERAQTARDSLAWALFRQKKFEAARKEQIAAINEAKANIPTGQKISADLYFHLAEIERALKNVPAAKANYEAALQVEPEHAPSLNGLHSLAGSTPGPTPAPGAPPDEAPDDAALRA
jgi:tetratricopeptide (TPR) repeat protein